MKVIECEITGTAPLLQNRYPIEDEGANKSRAKKQVHIPEDDAKKCLYQRDGKIFQPSEHIFQCLVKTGTDFKYEGKKNYKQVIAAGIDVEPVEIPLITDKPYEIDMRMVVIAAARNARVPKYRPKFNNWRLRFTIKILDDNNITPVLLKQILERAGETKGIGDYRPRFGRFMVTMFKET